VEDEEFYELLQQKPVDLRAVFAGLDDVSEVAYDDADYFLMRLDKSYMAYGKFLLTYALDPANSNVNRSLAFRGLEAFYGKESPEVGRVSEAFRNGGFYLRSIAFLQSHRLPDRCNEPIHLFGRKK
jgi:hypothetical protein